MIKYVTLQEIGQSCDGCSQLLTQEGSAAYCMAERQTLGALGAEGLGKVRRVCGGPYKEGEAPVFVKGVRLIVRTTA